MGLYMSRRVAALGVNLALLAGCASGGGASTPVTSGSSTPPTTTTTPSGFTSWSAVHPPATATLQGIAQEITYTTGLTGVNSVSTPSAVTAATYVETLGANGLTTTLQIQSALRTMTFSVPAGDQIGPAAQDMRLDLVTSADQTRLAILADPSAFGWNYQSFGVWEAGVGTAGGSVGAVSAGAMTAATAIPASGTATFTGGIGGVYFDPAGGDHRVGASLTVNADFTARTAILSSPAMTDLSTGAVYSGTGVSGTLSYAAGQNSLTGTLSTSRLAGTATARFYGPAADEVGGVFMLGSGGVEQLGGAFGAKRGP